MIIYLPISLIHGGKYFNSTIIYLQSALTQPTLAEVTNRKWSRDDQAWKKNAKRLVEMVAIDMEPLSLVERDGFKRFVEGLQPRFDIPGRKWLTDIGMPNLYTDVKAAIQRDLGAAEWVSFTSDIWTTEHTNISFISLTAHWIMPDFKRKMAVLHVKEFTDSHTGINIAESLNGMLDDWSLRSKVNN